MAARAAPRRLLAPLLAGCSLLPAPTGRTATPDEPSPFGPKVFTPASEVQLKAINNTTMPVVLVINGVSRDMAPESSLDLGAGELGPLPWDARFLHVSGRQLLQLTIGVGESWQATAPDGTTEVHAPEARVGLRAASSGS